MAEIREQYGLLKAKLEAGEYDIAVTATSKEVKESEYSNSVPYTQDENLFYEYSGREYYIVTGRKTASTDITISSEYNDGKNGQWPVREIGTSAFLNKDIVSVKIPTCVKLIDDSAFSGCTSLTTVEIVGLEEIAIYFYNNRKWNDITCSYEVAGEAAEKIMTISGNGICRISVPANATKLYFGGINTLGKKEKTSIISQFALGRCFYCSEKMDENGSFYALEYEYDAPEVDNYVTIGPNAFKNCTAIPEIFIPNSVVEIDDQAFGGCSALKTISFDEHSCLTRIGNIAFADCKSLSSSLVFPFYLETVGNMAFSICTSLTYVKLNSKLREIGTGAFGTCFKLENVIVPEDYVLESIGTTAFSSCKKLKSFTVPATVREFNPKVFDANCDSFELITFKRHYGWFFAYGKGDMQQPIPPEEFADGYALAALLTTNTNASMDADYNGGLSDPAILRYPWTNLAQMPAPKISLSLDGVLTITDSTGIADMFTIYAKKSDWADYRAAAYIPDLRKSE